MFELVRRHRRRTLRRAFHTDCQAVRLDDFRLIGDRILDLSPRGALVECERPVIPGEELLLSFRAPRRGPYVDTTAEVRRIFRRGKRYVAGTSFMNLEREAHEELLVRLAGFPPPLPRSHAEVDYAETVRRIALGA